MICLIDWKNLSGWSLELTQGFSTYRKNLSFTAGVVRACTQKSIEAVESEEKGVQEIHCGDRLRRLFHLEREE